jgi:chromatin remodeling complex protein RSC6
VKSDWPDALTLARILADDKLQPIFGSKKLDMFQMTKAVNKHLK